MRPMMRQPPSGTMIPRLLLSLPLGLAAFALILQFSSHTVTTDSAAFGLFNEHEFISRADRLPRLERQLRKNNPHPDQQPTQLPLPQGLGDDDWVLPEPNPTGPKIAFIVTTAESVTQIRVWLAYHRAIGVSLFYLFVEGNAATPESMAVLRAEEGVKVIPRDKELEDKQAKSRIWKETWLSAFFNKPCNHELFVKQSLNMEVGIHMARADGADWLLHIDTDEMIYPGGTRDYSLQQTLGSVPPDVDLLVFPNYESLAETAAVEDPFVEVSLFKRNYAHVVSDFYFDSYATVARGNPNYFTTYGNGKSAARVIDGLRPNGAHRWHNYNKEPKEWSSEQGAVLHYTYNRFSDLISRRDRCDCAPTKEDAERCFILPFDRQAFLEASLKTDAQLMKFFKQRLVWDNVETVGEMLQKGLFVRLYEPQLLVRGFLQAIKQKDAKAKQAAALTGGQGLRQEADVSKAAIAANSLPSRPAAPEKQQLDNKPAAVGIDATENVAVSQVQGDSVQEEQRKQALNGGGKGAT